ncbi:interleukin-1 receptor-associated kinase 1-binding protein 1 homolog [Hoplias malabaricus]|uniref:interleukin-1 receptor-associated kinase 1-binding protein 1 homolog n=1 Tax=Hoplias malabaricus TaxID=27720 RepID=UPI0034624426
MAVSPTRVFSALIPIRGGLRGLPEELATNSTDKAGCPQERRLEVTGSAELNCPPDTAALTVSVSSNKPSHKEAQSSVNRRLEYILQTITQHGVREEDLVVTKFVQRDGDLFRMQTEVSGVFSDFKTMECVRSVLIEKLDKSVCVGEPHFSHSDECLSLLRRRVFVAAVETARFKAKDVCNVLGQALGRPLLVREEETREWTYGQQDGVAVPLTLQQKVGQTAVCASSRVFVTFELRPKDITRKKF